MFRCLKRLFPAPGPRRPAARRPHSSRPQVEALEAREVPAQLSTADGVLAVAAIDSRSHFAMVHTPRGWTGLGSDAATDVSMGFAPEQVVPGRPVQVDVFVRVLAGNGWVVAWTASPSDWWFTPHWLYGPWGTSVSEISAAQSGRSVFAIASDGNVWLSTDQGDQVSWVNLGGPQRQPVQHISAGLVSPTGKDVVFAIGYDGHIYGHNAQADPRGDFWYLVDGSARFTQLSATQHDQVFALDQSGALHQAGYVATTAGFAGWVDWAQGRPPSGSAGIALSAASYGNYDEVYVIDSSHDVYVHHPNGWQTGMVDYGITEIAAAGGDWFYDVFYHQPYFIRGSYWQSEQYLGGPVL
jgi:hypothetical protein